jgi:hypothetical protein
MYIYPEATKKKKKRHLKHNLDLATVSKTLTSKRLTAIISTIIQCYGEFESLSSAQSK